MARRGPMSAAKRKREMAKREKRQLKLERRALRAEERAQAREGAHSDTEAQEDHDDTNRV